MCIFANEMDKCLTIIHSDVPRPVRLNCPYYYQPDGLSLSAAKEVQQAIAAMPEWTVEVERGKMFGVLIVETPDGGVGYLKAYSGQIGGREDWDGWVPAVFDYLHPDGYFCRHENEISDINRQVAELTDSPRHILARARLARAEKEAEQKVADYRCFMAEQKALRRQRRAEGEADEVLVRESQFQKAELRRMKAALEAELLPLRAVVTRHEEELVTLKRIRKQMSDALQQWLFSKFVMLNANGDERTLLDIFKPTAQRIPPSGAGECCAPKLLQYAYMHGYKPLSIAEFWWGESPVGEVRQHLNFYPACQGKCRPILDFMLQGIDVMPNPLEQQECNTRLDIIYEDNWLIAVDKPAGMLSVPGKGQRLSALEILRKQLSQRARGYLPSGFLGELYPVHRLDMQTSGILFFSKSAVMQGDMQKMFAGREVRKQYRALLDGVCGCPQQGVIELPLAADFMNRPRQCVDMEKGKSAVTRYYILCTREGKTLIDLFPHTGRTHQLRVHCAHKDGLGIPIAGDDIYGYHSDRLYLHAMRIEFLHPITAKQIIVESKCPF